MFARLTLRNGNRADNAGGVLGCRGGDADLSPSPLAATLGAYEYDDDWLAEVSATTGAPVLACWVFESDVAHIRGLSRTGKWDCWLNLSYAAGMLVEQSLEEVASALLDEGEPDALDRYRSEHFEEESARLTREISLVAQKAAAWAEQAGSRFNHCRTHRGTPQSAS